MMRTRPAVAPRVLATFLAATLLGACSSTGEPGHTAAVDVVQVDADGVTQTVVPAGDGFDRITVTVATFGETDGVDGVLELEVAPADPTPSGPGGRHAIAQGADLADNAAVTFVFEPYADAGGRTFEATFRYAGTEPLALYRNPYDAYADGELRPDDGDLVFSLGHADRVGGTVDALGRSVREAAGVAGGDPVFLVVWAAGLLALVAGAVAVRRRDARRGRAAAST